MQERTDNVLSILMNNPDFIRQLLAAFDRTGTGVRGIERGVGRGREQLRGLLVLRMTTRPRGARLGKPGRNSAAGSEKIARLMYNYF
ncbi:MAG: hypothetical protein WKG07_18710 [Hymenobacter sp.]